MSELIDSFNNLDNWDLYSMNIKEMQAYEKGKMEEAESIIKFIKKWNGSTNSVLGDLLMKKFEQYKKQELHKKLDDLTK